MEQALLPTFEGPVLVAGPVVVCFEVKGRRRRVEIAPGHWKWERVDEPGWKGRHRSRIVYPKHKFQKAFIQNYPDPETQDYEETIASIGRHFMGARAPVEGPVALLVHSFRPVPASWSGRQRSRALAGAVMPTSRPDWDNYGKITDALNKVVWLDDSQVCDGRVIKRYSDDPGLRVEVREFVAR